MDNVIISPLSSASANQYAQIMQRCLEDEEFAETRRMYYRNKMKERYHSEKAQIVRNDETYKARRRAEYMANREVLLSRGRERYRNVKGERTALLEAADAIRADMASRKVARAQWYLFNREDVLQKSRERYRRMRMERLAMEVDEDIQAVWKAVNPNPDKPDMPDNPDKPDNPSE